MDTAHRAVEQVAREGYGRLVAWLTARCRDPQLAEDAVADALEAALRSWPERGIPERPEAWLLTAARRKMIDATRRGATRRDAVERLRMEAEEAASVPFRAHFPDRRVELLFSCAHEAIPEAMRTPLMLQLVLGLSAERIGSALLVKPATMGQRLVRAKQRMADAKLELALPEGDDALRARLGPVLAAIYAAYGAGWESDVTQAATGLSSEALWLASLVANQLREAEALGLYALLLHCEARRGSRRDASGELVPLEAQDPATWDLALIAEAEKALRLAARQRVPGPYQLEASIQSYHADRVRTGTTDWAAIHASYGVLVARYPTLGAYIGQAASYGRVGAPAEGLALLDRLEEGPVARHQPFWAVRAHLLAA
ncbi:MAG: DUF6596 domain-containing protein, partial [Myxococcota bacterium]